MLSARIELRGEELLWADTDRLYLPIWRPYYPSR